MIFRCKRFAFIIILIQSGSDLESTDSKHSLYSSEKYSTKQNAEIHMSQASRISRITVMIHNL